MTQSGIPQCRPSQQCSPPSNCTTMLPHHYLPGPVHSPLAKKLYEMTKCGNASSYTDITLICPDGTRISTVRMHLAISSPYFEKLLTSDFAEKRCSDIYISISGRMLHELLEFIYIDDCPLIRCIRSANHASVDLCDTIRDLMELAFTAEYTCMERLLWICQAVIRHLYTTYHHLASVVLPIMRQRNSEWCQQIYQNALENCTLHFSKTLFLKFHECKFACGVMHLDNEAALDVFSFLRRNNHNAFTQSFAILVLWASGGTAQGQLLQDSLSGEFSFKAGSKISFLDTRLKTAKRIAGWFNLIYFAPSFLSKVVEPTGLVEASAINYAYKEFSLRYEDQLGQIRGCI